MKDMMWWYRFDLSSSIHERAKGSCEHGKKLSVSIIRVFWVILVNKIS
jgi:hypothetical protein